MVHWQRFCWGAIGGALPVLLAAFKLDVPAFAALIDANQLTLGKCVGYALRSAALVVSGGLIGVLNPKTNEPVALIQLGVAAPALLGTYIHAVQPAHAAERPAVAVVSAADVSAVRPIVLAGWLDEVVQGLNLNETAAQIRRTPNAPPSQTDAGVGISERGTGTCFNVPESAVGPNLETAFPSARYDIRQGGCAR